MRIIHQPLYGPKLMHTFQAENQTLGLCQSVRLSGLVTAKNVCHYRVVSLQLSQQFDDIHKRLQLRHNERDDVSNYQPQNCLLNRLFRRRSKKTSKLRITGLCVGNSLANSLVTTGLSAMLALVKWIHCWLVDYLQCWPPVRLIHWWLMVSLHRVPVMWKVFPSHKVIMCIQQWS